MAQRDAILGAAAKIRHELAEGHVELEKPLADEREDERRRRELGQ